MSVQFARSSVNIIDFVATLSFYIDLVLAQFASHLENAVLFSTPLNLSIILLLTGRPRVLLHHPNPPSVQTDQALLGFEDIATGIFTLYRNSLSVATL